MASLQHRQFDRRAQRVRTKLRKVADGNKGGKVDRANDASIATRWPPASYVHASVPTVVSASL